MNGQAPPVFLSGEIALFLDFDGTLVDLAEEPDAISVSPDLVPLLERLSHKLAGRLAIVTGRSIENINRHLSCPGLALSGSHGAELRYPDGTNIPVAVPQGLKKAHERAARLATENDGIIFEPKPTGFAVHYRKAPEKAEFVHAFAAEIAAKAGMIVQRGKMVVEVKSPAANKADAVRAFMAEPEFRGVRPIFVGDDLTDEDAFHAVLKLGGGGILVGPERETAAVWRLENVDAVSAWLLRVAER